MKCLAIPDRNSRDNAQLAQKNVRYHLSLESESAGHNNKTQSTNRLMPSRMVMSCEGSGGQALPRILILNGYEFACSTSLHE